MAVVAVYVVGGMIQMAIGYLVLKAIVKVVKALFSQIVAPFCKALAVMVWTIVKAIAFLLVGGLVVYLSVFIIALIAL